MYLPLKITQVTKENYLSVVERLDYLQRCLDSGQGTGAEKEERDQLLILVIAYCDEKEGNKPMTPRHKELLKKAVSFLRSNIPAAEEALDITIDEKEVEELEKILYNTGD